MHLLKETVLYYSMNKKQYGKGGITDFDAWRGFKPGSYLY